MTISDVIENLGKRHEVIRTGERAEIPAHVRSAVWFRDNGRCRMCTWGDGSVTGRSWHLDHVIPWSAGGPDDSTNLRVLCERHNVERSNFYDLAEIQPQRPVTWWCINCFSPEMCERWEWVDGIPLDCPLHPYGEGCRVIAGYQRVMQLTGTYPDWHQRDPIEGEYGPIAYCAHCDAPAPTAVLL